VQSQQPGGAAKRIYSIAVAQGENELAAGGIFFWFLNYLAVCFI